VRLSLCYICFPGSLKNSLLIDYEIEGILVVSCQKTFLKFTTVHATTFCKDKTNDVSRLVFSRHRKIA
jgi:hypothetical protein